MHFLGLLVPVFFAVQFVVVLGTVVSAMLFADPQVPFRSQSLTRSGDRLIG